MALDVASLCIIKLLGSKPFTSHAVELILGTETCIVTSYNPTLVEEENETPFTRVWKPFPSIRVLKP